MSDETLAQKLTGRKDGTPEQAQEMVNALAEAASLAESQNQDLQQKVENKAAILNAIEALLDVDDEHTGWDRIVALQERAEKAEARVIDLEADVARLDGALHEVADIATLYASPAQETDQ